MGTHLNDMEPAYGEFVRLPGRNYVHAASLENLTPTGLISSM